MTRMLKALGLAFVAALAIGALTAQAASAHLFTSDSENGNTTLTGTTEGEEEFFANGTEGTPVKCHLKYDGTAEGKVREELTIKPTDTVSDTCQFASANDSGVRFNHCAYVFHGETNATGHATVAIECAEGSKIEITVAGLCTLKFGPQSLQGENSGVHYTTTVGANGKKEVTVEATVMNITYEAVGAFCSLGGISQGTHTTGGYKGHVTTAGYEGPATLTTGTELTTPTAETAQGEQVNIATE